MSGERYPRKAASRDGAVQPYLTSVEADAVYNLIASWRVSNEPAPGDTEAIAEEEALGRVLEKLKVR